MHSLPEVDPGFSERGSEHRGVSLKQGVGPPEAIGFLLLLHQNHAYCKI